MTSDTLSFLTWNLALLAPSAEAPPGWGLEHTEAAVRQVALEAEVDLVLFQELPRLVPYVDTHDMVRANPESHQGNLATLVSHDLLARHGEPAVATVPGCAVLVTIDDLTVANVHLTPGTGAAAAAGRLDQLARIVEVSPTPRIAIIGDTNTRIDELDALADADLAAPRPPRPTWNSRQNPFNAKGAPFAAYFTRAFVSPGVELVDQRVLDSPIEAEGRRFHLSDHFALTGRIERSAGQ